MRTGRKRTVEQLRRAVLQQEIRSVLQADEDACLVEILHLLSIPAVSDLELQNHARCVRELLRYDAGTGGKVAETAEAAGIGQRELWEMLVDVLRRDGLIEAVYGPDEIGEVSNG